MTRLLEQHAASLDNIALSWGMASEASVLDGRLSALALQQLDWTPAGALATCDDATLLRRCGLPVIPGITLSRVMSQLRSVTTRDVSMLWVILPDLESSQRARILLAAPSLLNDWLKPMKDFCQARGPASADQRAQVQLLLRRCGWVDSPNALSLVLDVLQWDTIEVLRFALERLRRHNDQLGLPMAAALEAEFGRNAVLPLRKLLDPDLVLFVAVAAPEQGHPSEPVCSNQEEEEIKGRKGEKKQKKRERERERKKRN